MSWKTIKRIFVTKFTPVQKNKWVFTSFAGHYSDNPKYLSIKLHELFPEKEIVWCVKKQYQTDVPSYVKVVEYDSEEADKELASARVVIDNVYANRAFSVSGNRFKEKLAAKYHKWIFFKRNQSIYTTWHGTPLKKMGRDQIGNDVSDLVCCNIRMVLGNDFTSGIMKHLTFDNIPVKTMGTPRNDILFCADSNGCREKLGLPLDKKIILFAPTFRNDGKDVEGKNVRRSGLDQLDAIDFEALFSKLHDKFGGDWVMICRFHYHVAEMVDWEQLDKQYQGRIINGNLHDDMSEYMACTDLLLTDASSCMFDFAVTKKPCMLFFPDLEHYASKERGMYLSCDELPFPVALDFEQLMQKISEFNSDSYVNAVKRMEEKLGYKEDGHSAERILRWIIQNEHD